MGLQLKVQVHLGMSDCVSKPRRNGATTIYFFLLVTEHIGVLEHINSMVDGSFVVVY